MTLLTFRTSQFFISFIAQDTFLRQGIKTEKNTPWIKKIQTTSHNNSETKQKTSNSLTFAPNRTEATGEARREMTGTEWRTREISCPYPQTFRLNDDQKQAQNPKSPTFLHSTEISQRIQPEEKRKIQHHLQAQLPSTQALQNPPHDDLNSIVSNQNNANPQKKHEISPPKTWTKKISRIYSTQIPPQDAVFPLLILDPQWLPPRPHS